MLSSSDYSVTGSSGKNVGTYTAKITLKGSKYSGTKSLSYTVRPKGTSIKTPAGAKKALTAKWARQSSKMSTNRISGYQVQIARNKSFTSGVKTYKVKGYKTTYKKIKNLKRKTGYYVRVRIYMGSHYSAWSSVKSVKTK